jgi:VIT1/CCC1 family predicted Fe2+/Mn2+ transporter
MFRQGPVPALVHGLLEYLLGALCLAAPFLFGFDSGAAQAAAIVAGVVIIVLTASTALPTGLIKSVPVHAHVVLDYVIAALLIAAPFLFGFSDEAAPSAFFIIAGVALLLLAIATRYLGSDKRRGKRPPAERPAH